MLCNGYFHFTSCCDMVCNERTNFVFREVFLAKSSSGLLSVINFKVTVLFHGKGKKNPLIYVKIW